MSSQDIAVTIAKERVFNFTIAEEKALNFQLTECKLLTGVGTVLVQETPTGIIDGINKVFTTTFDIHAGDLKVFLNGLKEKYVAITGDKEFTFEEAPFVGDTVEVEYVKE